MRLNVALIVAAGSGEIRAAKEATTTIPIVMVRGGDPVGSGFVASLARPGGNITGLATLRPTEWKRELLKEIVQKLSRVAVVASTSVAKDYFSLFIHQNSMLVCLSKRAKRDSSFSPPHPEPLPPGKVQEVEAGGLMSYGVNAKALFKRAVYRQDTKRKPADLPVQQPTTLVQKPGLTIPPNVLARAIIK